MFLKINRSEFLILTAIFLVGDGWPIPQYLDRHIAGIQLANRRPAILLGGHFDILLQVQFQQVLPPPAFFQCPDKVVTRNSLPGLDGRQSGVIGRLSSSLHKFCRQRPGQQDILLGDLPVGSGADQVDWIGILL